VIYGIHKDNGWYLFNITGRRKISRLHIGMDKVLVAADIGGRKNDWIYIGRIGGDCVF
jgi:hypothetical protein